jgi:hypothetical protein
MTLEGLDPGETLHYYTRLIRAIETVPLAQKSVTEAACLVTDAAVKACGRLSAIPLPPEPHGCLDMPLTEIRGVTVGTVDEGGTSGLAVTVDGESIDSLIHSITLFPLSGTQAAADELAAQIERARSS